MVDYQVWLYGCPPGTSLVGRGAGVVAGVGVLLEGLGVEARAGEEAPAGVADGEGTARGPGLGVPAGVRGGVAVAPTALAGRPFVPTTTTLREGR